MAIKTGASRAAAEAVGDSSASTHLLPSWVARFAPRFRHVANGFDGTRGMDILTFQQRVVEAYGAIFAQLQSGPFAHPVRFWAFIPGIHDDLGPGLDRYMAFNAGRYGAFARHLDHPTSFSRCVPTASAVGVHGDYFELHCLAAEAPGLPVENPRQVSAYHYSRRFGPMPPCFARATLLTRAGSAPLLIVGGTASVVGEESRHVGDIEAQTDETLRNLASIVAAASNRTVREDASPTDLRSLLTAFGDLRVYYTDAAHRGAIAERIEAMIPSECGVEWMNAALCRHDLLVEIEGLALPPTPHHDR